MKSMKKLTGLFAAVATLACAAALAIPAMAFANATEVDTADDLISAVAKDGEIELTQDITLTGPLTIEAGATVTIDLKGHTLSYNSTTQNEAMITNKGVLVINDTSENSSENKIGVINYNYTGAADSSYGKGNYTISNAGTLTINGGKITIANLGSHAKYPIDNNSTTGDAVLTITGGHLYNYNTCAIRQFCNSPTYKNSVTIEGGLIEGYCAIWVQNPGSGTVNGTLSITGGEIKTTAAAYVNGTSELENVGSAIYCTVGTNGAWSTDSFVSITGGTINENVYLAEDAPSMISVNGNVCNGYVETPELVAEVNGVKYSSLHPAIDAAKEGGTVSLLSDVQLTKGLTISTGSIVNLDLNGFTITGTPAEAKAYAVIENKGNLTIVDSSDKKTGKILCKHELTGSTAYAVNTINNEGTLRIEAGTIENASTASSQIGYAIDNNSTSMNAITTIAGGMVKVSGSNYYDGIRQFCNNNTKSNEVVVTGGEVSSLWLQNPSDGSGNGKNAQDVKGSVSISGGTVKNLYLEPSKGFTASVTKGSIGNIDKFETDEGRDLVGFITGGTFSNKPDESFLADGYQAVESANGENTVWVVSKKQVVTPPAPPAPPAASKPIEVPVEGDSTVKVEATVDGTKAEVEEITPEQIESVTSGGAAANVTVDFSGLDQAVTEVSIPASSVEAIAEAAKDTANSVSGLEVKLPEATVQFDASALTAVTEAIAEETAGADAPAAFDVKVTLVVEAVAVEDLAPAQQEALKDAPNAVVVQATVLVNDRPVHDFKGGLAMVTVPYELPEGANPADVTVWYVSSDGTMEAMQTTYKDGLVTFWAPHFSDYVVTSDEANAAHVCPSAKFSDFRAGAWYHGPVDWAVMNGVLRGDGDGKATLRPTGAVTRAELLTMLYRIEGSPAATSPCTFSDVKAGAWYEGAVSWAQEAGVIKGDDNGKGTVRPNSPLTREEMAVILYRYAQLKGLDVSEGQDTNILSFNDFEKLASWSVEAMQWACGAGIVGGYTDAEGNQTGYLGPKDDAQRAQAAAMLQRLDAAYGIL